MTNRISLVLTLGLALGASTIKFASPATAQAATCKHERHGAISFEQSYPAPSQNGTLEVPKDETVVVEMFYSPRWSTETQEYHLIPISSQESGNGRFQIVNPYYMYVFYQVNAFTGCSYEQIMCKMANVAANQLDGNPKVRWALPWDKIGIIKPEIPGTALPRPAFDPLYQCTPLEWNDVELGHQIPPNGYSSLEWELEFNGTSVFGNYPGKVLVGPARMRRFWGECDTKRWWEPFAFERMLAQERDSLGPRSDVEMNPNRFVRNGLLFLPHLYGSKLIPPPTPAGYPSP